MCFSRKSRLGFIRVPPMETVAIPARVSTRTIEYPRSPSGARATRKLYLTLLT
jgi:hypothetical protein